MIEQVGHAARVLAGRLLPALFAATLAACGGGSDGGGSSPPPPPPPPPPPESARLYAEFVAQDTNNQFVRVWDPAHPEAAIQNVRIVESDGIVWSSSRLVFSDATSYDPATHTVRTLGHAKAFYENDGKVYSIDLRGGQSHAPVQLSSAVDVDELDQVIPLGADGVDAWITARGGLSHWAIRSDMSATDAPNAVYSLTPLRDLATGLPQALFVTFGGGGSGTAVQPITYGVRDLDFATIAVPAVDAMVESDSWVGADPAQAGLAYLRIGRQLRALRWGAAGVSVDAADLYDFASLFSYFTHATADASTLYFTDGTALLAMRNGSASAVGSFGLPPAALFDGGTYIAASESHAIAPVCCEVVETMLKTDGSVARVTEDYVAMKVLGVNNGYLLLSGAAAVVGGLNTASGYSLVDAQGVTQWTSDANTADVGVVWSATTPLDHDPMPVAVLTCAHDAATGQCADAGALSQVDLQSGASTALGTLAGGIQQTHGDLFDGVPGVIVTQTYAPSTGGFGGDGIDKRDAWQLTPGAAGSLARTTTYLP